MEYRLGELAKLAGVSTRTLRYYDQIGLLSPCRIAGNGYRYYSGIEVDRLQQILFFRELGVELEEIGRILSDPDFHGKSALERHLEQLRGRRNRLDGIIALVEKTIRHQKGETEMTDQEKFEAMKQAKLRENEDRYGAEIREKYGEATIEASNAKMMGMSQPQWEAMQETERKLFEVLDAAFTEGDSGSPTAEEAFRLHREWLGYTWPEYSPEAHIGLAQGYRADQRFLDYYDRGGPGRGLFLCEVIERWAK
ncbi:MAG: MerR family transcriptional regulator [Oscillospiraceae bacterium]